MATVTGFTSGRMKQIEDTTIVSGRVTATKELILTTRAGVEINAGDVEGPQGPIGDQGPIGPVGPAGLRGGTTAQRDSIFGVPATDAARVALANSTPTWYNTDRRWEESYFATTGLAGLTATGLLANFSSGWYPIDRGAIFIHAAFTGGFIPLSSSEQIIPFATTPRRKGGATIVNNNALKMPIGGMYEVSCRLYASGGASSLVTGNVKAAGTLVVDLSVVKPDTLDQRTFTSVTRDYQADQPFSLYAMVAGTATNLYASGINGSYMQVEYVGPPLANY